ncbi:hypothetical protein KUCAC02_023421, partial [Chaenocephalus aceratus]
EETGKHRLKPSSSISQLFNPVNDGLYRRREHKEIKRGDATVCESRLPVSAEATRE